MTPFNTWLTHTNTRTQCMHRIIFIATVKKKGQPSEMQLSCFQQVLLLELRFVCFSESQSVWGDRGGAITLRWSVLIWRHNVLQVYMPAKALCQCRFLLQQWLSDALWVEVINIFYYHHFVLPLAHKLQNNWHLCNFRAQCLSSLKCVCVCMCLLLTMDEQMQHSALVIERYASEFVFSCTCICVCLRSILCLTRGRRARLLM